MADPTKELSSSIDSLATFLVGELTMGETLRRVAELAEDAIPGAELTGVTLLTDGRPTTAVCTDPATEEVDSLQYERGEGPCLTAFRQSRVVRVDSLRADTRWPEVSDATVAKGFLSSLSAPLIVQERALGAINLYGRSEQAFSTEDEETALTFGMHASIVLANAQAFWSAYDLSRQLEKALESRASIEQAKGVLIEQSGVHEDEAFELLKRASQRENRKLRDIAAEVVRRAQERRR